MTGIAGVKIKLMPTSPEANLKEIEHKAKKIVEDEGGINREYEIQPIAFGLKAIIVFFQWPEEKEIECLEDKLREIPDVQSVQTIDMRKIA
jgi:translation elongation factor aEF-1 beta